MLKELFNPANYFLNPYAIPNIIVALYCFSLGILALVKKKGEGFVLFLLTLSTGIYLLFIAFMYMSLSPQVAYLWNKMFYFAGGVCFIPVNTYFFSVKVTKTMNNKIERITLYTGYLLMIIFAIITAFTDLMVKFPPRKFFYGYITNVGIVHHIFMPFFIGYALKGTYNFYRAYKKEKNLLEKNRLKIFLYTYLVGYIAVWDFLAAYGIGIYPFGYAFIGTYLTLIAYNFIKYKALGIETVFHKTSLWLASIILIIIPAGILEIFILKTTSRLNITLNILIASFVLFFFAYYYFYLRSKIDYIFGKKHYAYYELLGRISEKVSTTLDIEEFSGKLLNELDDCILPQKELLWVVDEKKQNFFLFAEKIPPRQCRIFREKQEPLSEEDPIVKHLTTTREVLEPPVIPLNPQLKHLAHSPYFSFLSDENIEALVPLTMEKRLVGILGLGRKRSLRIYAKADIGILNTLGKELGISIYNALHHQDVLERQRLQHEIILARNIQESLLPQESPEISGISLYGLYVPSKEVGGDYYDFIAQSTLAGPDTNETRQRLYVAIGDVSGKGLDSGLIMTVLKSSLYQLTRFYSSPLDVILELNNFLYNQIKQQKFVSFLLFSYSPLEPDKITYSSAGHEHILIYRNRDENDTSSPKIEAIKSGGIILGMIDNIKMHLNEQSLTLNKGDKILLYTDGSTEARNPREEFYGISRLIKSFQTHGNLSIKDTVHNVYEDIKTFISTRDQYDDITLVGIQKD